jgi:hypothetical protein
MSPVEIRDKNGITTEPKLAELGSPAGRPDREPETFSATSLACWMYSKRSKALALPAFKVVVAETARRAHGRIVLLNMQKTPIVEL